MTARTKKESVLATPIEDGEELVLTEAEAAEPEPAPAAAAPFVPEPVPAPVPVLHDGAEDLPARPRFGWVAPLVASLLVIAWGGVVGYFLPSVQREGLSPLGLIEFVAAVCVPPALIGILYLMMLRTSSAEARRFGATARAMRAEAASLEATVGALAARIEENRRLLAEQAGALASMGESASERMNTLAQAMSHQVRSVDASTQALREAVIDAERRVEVVLTSLPRAGEELHQIAARADEAGLAAGQRAAALDVQLTALAERGREADAVAGGAAERLAAHIARMEATSETASARLEKVTAEMSTAVDEVLDRAAAGVDEARKGIAAQGEAMLAMLNANQAALDRTGKDHIEALGTSIGAIEEAVTRVSGQLGEQKDRSEALFQSITDALKTADREFAVMHAAGMDRAQGLAASISALTESFDAMGASMRAGEETARGVIGTSDSLLTALDAVAREMDESMPEALDRLDARIAASRKVVADSKPELLALVTAAESTHDAIEAIADVVRQQRDTLAKTQQSLLDTLADGREKADALETIVDDAISTTRRFAEEAAPQLVDALLRVRETSAQAAAHARETLASIVPQAAAALEDAGHDALSRAVDATVRRQLAELAETTEAAVTAATRASERLTQQMLALAETTAAVDRQIDTARAEHEKNDSDNFARRVSLLIEALNSASIDITKVFSAEVTDSAWSAYLKGDRGVFTRRAVRLLDAGEARDIHRLYGEDEGFRDNVNRYIHDFEAMLRQILALRDGSPLGVTLLSSDMGKLYVALAQGIERLRA
ncbi:hypothetical protein ACFQ1E_11845 [Sphingomonas canadensis]|uniref:ATPase n=1 Tax=Sphingomonas canadensis TaxID=1219257 RepID=A0ABW3HC26_9SPHN|nr:hypothetical protein [Sphingomonas canadensis]MCW3836834.1 hypothetical protein [Sphingomonas canadensis]